MARAPADSVKFKRSRFVARFPNSYLYSPAHFWLAKDVGGGSDGSGDDSVDDVWRIGLTNFATRMLGEIVEFDFETKVSGNITVGEVVGWVEGFKATADLFCVAEGEFLGGNDIALNDPELVCSDPYGDGWLYSVKGRPDPQAVDVETYLQMLGETIDSMEEQPWKSPEIAE